MAKKILFILFLTVFAAVGCSNNGPNGDLYDSIVKKDKIVVGVSFDSKPFSYKDFDGQIKGLEADLAREIAKRLLGDPKKISFKNIAPFERVKAAKDGEVDMVISTMTITPERKKFVDFSNPYFIAGQAIAVKKDSRIDSHFDLNNKKVVVVLGTTGEKNIKRFAPNALIEAYVNNSEAINAFKSGSVDALTTDDALLQGFIMDYPNYVLLPERLTKEPYGIAFRKSRLSKTFKENLNEALNDMKYDGTINSIKDKWGIS